MGAANALANPARLLKSLPGALYEMGVAVVVALTFAPNLIADVQRLRAARRLRGRPDSGVRGLLQVGLPVLEGALERSVAARRRDGRPRLRPYRRRSRAAVRRTTTALTLGGLLGVCAGTYGLLTAEGGAYGMPVARSSGSPPRSPACGSADGARSAPATARTAGTPAPGWWPGPAWRSPRC